MNPPRFYSCGGLVSGPPPAISTDTKLHACSTPLYKHSGFLHPQIFMVESANEEHENMEGWADGIFTEKNPYIGGPV